MSPKRSLSQGKISYTKSLDLITPLVNQLLCPPGTLQEIETVLLDGRIQRVYKNQWPSLRVFWLWAARQHKEATYIVFENQRFTFAQIFDRSLKAAALFQDVYHVRKG